MCVCIYMCVCVHICIYVCVYIYVCTYIYICVSAEYIYAESLCCTPETNTL